MKTETALERALAIIAGFQRHGYKTKAAAMLDVDPSTIYRWARIGWNANVSAALWNATEKQVDVQELIEEGTSLGGGYTGKKKQMIEMLDKKVSHYEIAAKLKMQPQRVMSAAFLRERGAVL